MSSKDARIDKAMLAFDLVVEKDFTPNCITYNTLIDRTSNLKICEVCTSDMKKCFKTKFLNIVSYSVLVDGLCKGGRIYEVSRAFQFAINCVLCLMLRHMGF